ncbi:hypothetical protein AT03_19110 [Hafnia alvei FB1]|uniref:Uncharacterized protein n=1 Tax=Hafnia alvei FB1 TaxID=1453496 RepID=A0A097R6F9_HAFAL|nr:hypothetical protein AT03_19110 [Hafnia alvei FB1]
MMAGSSQHWCSPFLNIVCMSVIAITPMPEHISQSGKDAPNRTIDGAQEQPVRDRIIKTKLIAFAEWNLMYLVANFCI